MPILRSLAALLLVAALLPAQPVYQPKIGKASRDGLRAISGFTIDAGFERKLWAAEPMLANPVCLWVDARGRVFVGETFRQEQGGVPDNRSFSYWKDDDLKNQTLADRRAMYLTHRPHFAMQFTEHHDRIRLLQDTNGNGKADKASVFADGFNDILDGTGAGILARGNDVYYTCIPNVWRLRDVNGDGKVDRREILHTGYGIRIALRGHDLHGLVMGPDGRLYFSIGDRGYNITTDDGRVLKCPWSGAVFRCELDGSGLEVFATGLRNPQELAFDDLGNLFTGDNNSDSQDQARLVYVVEGGETGWRMNFQYKSDRGGWVSEGWWKTRHEGQAAFLIPPMAHLGAGPSGFVLYPGTGLPASFAGTFFMCDFRGGRKQSGVRSFKLKPKGAGYELASDDRWLWGCLATDVDFGPDGTMFVSDWVHGWSGTGKGRIYTFRHQDADARRAGDETARLLAGDFGKMDVRALAALLGHADRRVRLEAQYALVAKGIDGGVVLLAQAKSASARRLVRIHGLWGVGQLQRQHGVDLTQELIPLFGDDDAEVAAQAIRVCGEAQNVHATGAMVQALGAASARVRYFAALELGRVGSLHDVEAVVAMIRENANADVYLRHAGVMALTGIGSADALLARAGDPSPAVRLAILLALRRLKDVRVRRFL
ncbi:MAG: glucose dehydrogenase, partial [Planctomycetes bacterium]|nr:glucose dehydrogenase [Planctomycetota bacterium]